MCTIGTNLAIHKSSFINNAANTSGGAICAINSSFLISETIFDGNSAQGNGGAIICKRHCQIKMTGHNTFKNNSCQSLEAYGGAIYLETSQLIIYGTPYFVYNHAAYGGALVLITTNATSYRKTSFFKNSALYEGGGLYINTTHFNIQAFFVNFEQLILILNSAKVHCV